MASIALSTAGVTLSYGVEITAGTKPATFTEIKGVKSISDLNPEPSQLDCTSLNSTEYKEYIPGLKDVGGTVTLTFNNTDTLQTAWATAVSAAETAATSDLDTWWQISIPNLTKKFYFTGMPSDLGLSALEVDAVVDIDAYITPHIVKGWLAST